MQKLFNCGKKTICAMLQYLKPLNCVQIIDLWLIKKRYQRYIHKDHVYRHDWVLNNLRLFIYYQTYIYPDVLKSFVVNQYFFFNHSIFLKICAEF